MRLLLSAFLIALCSSLSAEAVNIEDCYTAVEANYPLVSQYGILERTEDLTLENISKAWLPQASLSAKASWQTETTSIPLDLSQIGVSGLEIPAMSKDQYGVVLDVTQALWDGGSTRAASASAEAATAVQRQNIEVSTYSLRERVNRLYFGILLADDYLRLNDLLLADLDVMTLRVENSITHGVANQSDLAALKVETVKARQQRAVYVNNRAAYIEILAALTGLDINETTTFDVPEYAVATPEIRRPELSLFDARIHSAQASMASVRSELMPRFSAFATGGFGRPGLDMFERSFSPYAFVGVRGTWNIGALYTGSNKRRLIDAEIQTVEVERETFLFNTALDLRQTDRETSMWLDQLSYDDEIIALQQSIVDADQAKLAAGTISGTDLARDINAVHMARQNKALHMTQSLLSSYHRKFITN